MSESDFLSQSQIQRVKRCGIALLLDVNETLIHTGAIDRADAQHDLDALYGVREAVEVIADAAPQVLLVFVSGNTFEYLRRVEEPLGLAGISGVSLSFISENGLVGRTQLPCGNWMDEISVAAEKSMHDMIKAAHRARPGASYLQGNEVRVTIKPTSGTIHPETLAAILRVGDQMSKAATWGAWVFDWVRVYASPHYIDIDPVHSLVAGKAAASTDKAAACDRIMASCPEVLPIAFGDSASDAGMFSLVRDRGGLAFQVRNSEDRWQFAGAIVTKHSFGTGVAHTLRAIGLQLRGETPTSTMAAASSAG